MMTKLGPPIMNPLIEDDLVSVHPLTKFPDKAWKQLAHTSPCEPVAPLDPATAETVDKVRFVCISDTHARIEKLSTDFVPHGDVLLHAGDFTNFGDPKEVYKFNKFLGKLPHRHKIVIAGNHDLSFDKNMITPGRITLLRSYIDAYKNFLTKQGKSHVRELLTNCIYLEDSATQVYGINLHGSPWTPAFHWWAFNAQRGQDILNIWNQIPINTDILITHGPPVGYGDAVRGVGRVGCVELLSVVQKRIKPKYHVFGHIHEGHGVLTDGVTTYVNASICDIRYRPVNQPIVFDYQLPPGKLKDVMN